MRVSDLTRQHVRGAWFAKFLKFRSRRPIINLAKVAPTTLLSDRPVLLSYRRILINSFGQPSSPGRWRKTVLRVGSVQPLLPGKRACRSQGLWPVQPAHGALPSKDLLDPFAHS